MHEIAHNFGCKHDNDNRDGGVENLNFYARGNLLANDNATIMVNGPVNRIQNFANPTIFFNNESTGENNSRDNARQLRLAAWRIDDYETGDDPVALTIDGPSTIYDEGQTYTWTGNTCNEIITNYQWSWSQDGWTYYNIGSNSSDLVVNGSTFPPKDDAPTIFIRLIASFSNGQTVTEVKSVQNEQESIYYSEKIESVTLSENTGEIRKALGIEVFPNPIVSNEMTLKLEIPLDLDLSVYIYNQYGSLEKVIRKNKYYRKGKYNLKVNVENLTTGLKHVTVRSKDYIKSIHFVTL